MIKILKYFTKFILSNFKFTTNLAVENLALRQQLAVMKRTNKRPKIQTVDRIFWILFSKLWGPWQNPFVERLIGSIRCECIDNVVVLNNTHLKKVLSSYFTYYHDDRTHLGIEKRTPNGRSIQSKPACKCKVIVLPRCDGLHHPHHHPF